LKGKKTVLSTIEAYVYAFYSNKVKIYCCTWYGYVFAV